MFPSFQRVSNGVLTDAVLAGKRIQRRCARLCAVARLARLVLCANSLYLLGGEFVISVLLSCRFSASETPVLCPTPLGNGVRNILLLRSGKQVVRPYTRRYVARMTGQLSRLQRADGSFVKEAGGTYVSSFKPEHAVSVSVPIPSPQPTAFALAVTRSINVLPEPWHRVLRDSWVDSSGHDNIILRGHANA